MYKRVLFLPFLLLFLVWTGTGCSATKPSMFTPTIQPYSTQTSPFPTAAIATITPTHRATVTPSQTITPTYRAKTTSSPTKTLSPSRMPTLTDTPTRIPTPSPPPQLFGSLEGPVPQGAVERLGKGWSHGIAFSPKGDLLAVGSSLGVYLFRTNDFTQVGFFPSDQPLEHPIFSSDGNLLAGISGTNVIVWNADSGEQMQKLQGHEISILSIAISPDNHTLASCDYAGTMITWDVRNGKMLQAPDTDMNCFSGLAFSPDGKVLAAGKFNDDRLYLWDTQSWQQSGTVSIQNNGFFSIAFSPDGKYLAADAGDGTVNLWDTQNWQLVKSMDAKTGMDCITFSPDGTTLAASGWNHTVSLWDIRDGKRLFTLGESLPFVEIESLSFSPDGKTLAAQSFDNTVILWDVQTGAPLLSLLGFTDTVESLALSPDGNTVAAGSYGWMVTLWNLLDSFNPDKFDGIVNIEEGEAYKHVSAFDVVSVAFSPDGRYLVAGTGIGAVNGLAILWDLQDQHRIYSLEGHDNYFSGASFSPDGNTLITGTDDQIFFWDLSSGKRLFTGDEEDGISSFVLSPDGNTLAFINRWGSITENGKITLWDVSSKQPIRVLPDQRKSINQIAFSPKGHVLASGCDDGTIIIWDTLSGKPLRSLMGKSSVSSLAFSSNGNQLAVGSKDGFVFIWNIKNGQLLQTLKGHNLTVTGLAFSPDGSILVSGSEDGTIVLWKVKP